jgi:POT family proton-dependent oligopeptide transporter
MNNVVILAGIVITLVTGIPVLLQLMKNHPKGLFILFFAEMWERFSYYGMRGLLIFYLTQHFLFSDQFSNSQYGSYTSLVYLLPLIGGMMADRYLGTRKAVAFGAVLLTIGQLGMAITAAPATQTLTYQGHAYQVTNQSQNGERHIKLMLGGKAYDFGSAPDGGMAIKNLPASAPVPSVLPKGSFELKTHRDVLGVNLFYTALALIIMGVGFLKPNIATIVGQLYKQGDPRRDSGFTLYYYGINLGAFWAAALCGYLGQNIGWWAGFGLAGIGMALGWVVFMLGKPWLQGKGEPPNPAALAQKVFGPVNREWLIYLASLLGAIVVFFLVQRNTLVGYGLGASIIASLGFIAWFMLAKCDRIQRERMMLAVMLIFGAVIFFTLFEQAGTSLNLFADRNVDLNITPLPVVKEFLGQHWIFATRDQLAQVATPDGLWIDTGIASSQTQSFNAGWILIFAPIFAALWAFLGRRNLDPNPMLKFGLGLAQVGLGFMVVVWGAGLADANARVPMILLGGLYLLHTTGEMCLSPVGLSEITKLSVASVASFMMAVWYAAVSIAQFVGGKIAALTSSETVGGQVLDPHAALAASLGVFQKLGWAGIGAGVVFIALSPFLKKWAHGVNDARNHVAPEPIAPTVDGELLSVSPSVVRAERDD